MFIDEIEVEVAECDPLKNIIKVRLPDGNYSSLPPQDLLTSKPIKQSSRKRKPVPSKPAPVLVSSQPTSSEPFPSSQSSQPIASIPLTSPPPTAASNELEYTTFILNTGLVIRVGFVYFIESSDVPFVVSRIFQSNGSHFAICFKCKLSVDKHKVIGFFKDFQCTLSLKYFVRAPHKGELSFPFCKDIDILVSEAQSRLFCCQLANLGAVGYLRDLRRHALGAQMRQAVFSGISLSATKPSHVVSLGPFEPLHDQAIFGMSEANSFKVKLDHLDLYTLDTVMGAKWDVKPLRPDIPDSFFKFVTTATVFLDRKTLLLKFSFTYAESTFCLDANYRTSCKALFIK